MRHKTSRRVDSKTCAGISSDHFDRQGPAGLGGFAQERMIFAHQDHGSRPKQKPLATGRRDVITARQPQIDATVLQIGPEVRRTRLQRDAKLRSPQMYLIENPIENVRHHQTARGDEEVAFDFFRIKDGRRRQVVERRQIRVESFSLAEHAFRRLQSVCARRKERFAKRLPQLHQHARCRGNTDAEVGGRYAQFSRAHQVLEKLKMKCRQSVRSGRHGCTSEKWVMGMPEPTGNLCVRSGKCFVRSDD